jgi:glycosyltransferase involved in cell wall biosynthesis
MQIVWASHRDIRNPRAGGAERTVYEISRRLARKGHQLHVITGGWPGCDPKDSFDGARVYRASNPVGPHIELLRVLAKQQHAVVVSDVAHVVPWLAPRLLRRPGVVFFRHLHARTLSGQVSPPVRLVLSGIERSYPWIYDGWKFVTESNSSASDLVALGVEARMVQLIRPGVDSQLFRPLRKCPVPQIIYFAGLKEYKRPEHALIAFAIARQSIPTSTLVVVGDSPRLERLRRLSGELGTEESVTFTGRITREELARIVGESWVNLHCSVAEGWGYSVTEACSAGVPTVAYDVPGVRDSVTPGITGRLVTGQDPRDLAKALVEVIRAGPQAFACRASTAGLDWDIASLEWERLLSSIVPNP